MKAVAWFMWIYGESFYNCITDVMGMGREISGALMIWKHLSFKLMGRGLNHQYHTYHNIQHISMSGWGLLGKQSGHRLNITLGRYFPPKISGGIHLSGMLQSFLFFSIQRHAFILYHTLAYLTGNTSAICTLSRQIVSVLWNISFQCVCVLPS